MNLLDRANWENAFYHSIDAKQITEIVKILGTESSVTEKIELNTQQFIYLNVSKAAQEMYQSDLLHHISKNKDVEYNTISDNSTIILTLS